MKIERTIENEELLNPLVSIIVITYNSSKFVLETLQSAKDQSYKNIELIISDDCSTDETIEICQNWLEKNKYCFKRTKLLTVKNNSGIAPNCNRGVRAAKGKWIKLIAGDDILIENCIAINIEATQKNLNFFYFSKFSVLTDDKIKKKLIEQVYEKNSIYFEGNQFDNLMDYGYYFPTITFFANTDEIKKIGLFNEDYPYQDDFPMWFKILKKGYQFCYIDKETVTYRIHGESIYNNNLITNKKWHKSFKNFFYQEMLPERLKRKQYLKSWDFIIHFLYLDITILLGNKKGFIDNCIKIIQLLSPLYLQNTLKRILALKIHR